MKEREKSSLNLYGPSWNQVDDLGSAVGNLQTIAVVLMDIATQLEKLNNILNRGKQ
ncbi:MAG: hypothetical protein II265_08620 [Clostridia bacterium]|nr:hypothetical protein [Clostridia bacterium]